MPIRSVKLKSSGGNSFILYTFTSNGFDEIIKRLIWQSTLQMMSRQKWKIFLKEHCPGLVRRSALRMHSPKTL